MIGLWEGVLISKPPALPTSLSVCLSRVLLLLLLVPVHTYKLSFFAGCKNWERHVAHTSTSWCGRIVTILSPLPPPAHTHTYVRARARGSTFSLAASSCFLAKSSSDSLTGTFFGTFFRGGLVGRDHRRKAEAATGGERERYHRMVVDPTDGRGGKATAQALLLWLPKRSRLMRG